MLNGKFNDKWLEMWYDKLVRRCETEKKYGRFIRIFTE